MPRKSKTKKVKEDKKKPIKSRKQKQKQKQSVNVNVHIDQSKRTHARQKQAEPVRQPVCGPIYSDEYPILSITITTGFRAIISGLPRCRGTIGE